MFQSLSGFFRPCNARFSAVGLPDMVKFQSLSGFFRPCNRVHDRHPHPNRHIVSIPVGFFQALQLG